MSYELGSVTIGTHKGTVTGAQSFPPPPPQAKSINTDFVDSIISKVLHDLRFSLYQLPKSPWWPVHWNIDKYNKTSEYVDFSFSIISNFPWNPT